MGFLSDNAGFQGPGEEFGNSWDSFRTGRGNFMTGPGGAKSNAQGIWSHTGTTDPRIAHISGPMGMSPRPMARPVPGAAPNLLQMLFGGGLFGGKRKSGGGLFGNLFSGGPNLGDQWDGRDGAGGEGLHRPSLLTPEEREERRANGSSRLRARVDEIDPRHRDNATRFVDVLTGQSGTPESTPEEPWEAWVRRNAEYRRQRELEQARLRRQAGLRA